MATPSRDVVEVARRFNHDLLSDAIDGDHAARRWPALKHVLIDPELIETFKPHEKSARVLKRLVQILGSAAVVLMLAALLGYAAELWKARQGDSVIPDLALFSEVSAVAALFLALMASRYGPFRRRWLQHRFVTEVLRQWHFRRLLDPTLIEQTDRSDDQTSAHSDDLLTLTRSLAGAVGAKMDELADLRRDPLRRIPFAKLPVEESTRMQLLDAYRVLRLDHQRDFAMYKISTDDKTFAGLSLLALSNITERLAGTTLVLALGCSIARLLVPFEWAPLAAISLGLCGVAVRVWRDGFNLDSERERYQEMLHELELLTARWENTTNDEQRFQIAEEVERAALEELRWFIRSHDRAQFLF